MEENPEELQAAAFPTRIWRQANDGIFGSWVLAKVAAFISWLDFCQSGMGPAEKREAANRSRCPTNLAMRKQFSFPTTCPDRVSDRRVLFFQ